MTFIKKFQGLSTSFELCYIADKATQSRLIIFITNKDLLN